MPSKKTKEVWEFGDFQTPRDLAEQSAKIISQSGFKPNTVLEPTCGKGSFLFSAIEAFPESKKFIGVDINKEHLKYAQEKALRDYANVPIEFLHGDFFELDWTEILKRLSEPILIVGNPPWVTSSELGLLQSSNLPEKSNFQCRKGLEALTGKSNFDISEWMILRYLEWLQGRKGMVAVLCKTAVARKVLKYAWKENYSLHSARIYKIDALKHFSASVDACFFVMNCSKQLGLKDCGVFGNLSDLKPSTKIGYQDGVVVFDVSLYNKWKSLKGIDKAYVWRSGVKHDCAKVMELKRTEHGFCNGFGKDVELEDTYVFPLFKSSDIANGDDRKRKNFMLVTQRSIGEDTSHIKNDAPKTWEYLKSHERLFAKRASSIYRNRPSFSVFGVGDYTFAPWKVAISGFYKKLNYKLVGPVNNCPAIFDDTVYFLSAWSKEEAGFLLDILCSVPAREFYSSMIYWSDKRPITIDLLKRLNLQKLASELGRVKEYKMYVALRSEKQLHGHPHQKSLFPTI